MNEYINDFRQNAECKNWGGKLSLLQHIFPEHLL